MKKTNNYIGRLKKRINNLPVIGRIYEVLFQIKKQIKIQRLRYGSDLKTLRKQNPSLIIVINDHKELMMINIAKKLQIPNLTLGWSSSQPPEHFAKKYKKLFTNNIFFLFLLKAIVPKSIYFYKGNYVSVIDPIISLSYLINGIRFNTPGKKGMLTDFITAPSNYEKYKMLKYGLPSSKIRVNGDNQNDKLMNHRSNNQEIREKLKSKFKINKNDLVVLIGLPPLSDNILLSEKEYQSSIIRLLKALLPLGNNVIFLNKIHPKDNIVDFKFIKYISNKIRLIDDYPIRDVLSISNLFIVNISSAIIDAIALDIPVITYNLKGNELIDSEMYSAYHIEKLGVQVFDDDSLLQKAYELLFDKNIINKRIVYQKNNIKPYAVLDGKCIDRNIETIYDILNKKDKTNSGSSYLC